METATLGRTGVAVTRLGLGCAPLGDLFTEVGEASARQVLQAAWDAGIRYFDTAPLYGHGKSEHRLGEFLRGRPREQFTVSTKVGRLLRPAADRSRLNNNEQWPAPLPFTIHFDYSYDGIMRSYEDSLQRLGLGCVELLVIHDLDTVAHPPERVKVLLYELAAGGWRALEELRAGGAVRGVGAGINELGLIPRFLDLLDPDFFLVAQDYNLLDHGVLEEEFARCEAAGAAIIVGALFASGILAAGGRGGASYRYAEPAPEVRQRVQSMASICDRHGVDLATAALQFPLAHPLVAAAIPGAVRPEYVAGNVRRLSTPIPAELWAEMKAAGLLRADAPVP